MFKIALLFLTISSIYHEAYWNDFLRGNENRYSIYIHAKESFEDDSSFKKYEIKNKIETMWTNSMKAQIELLREALKDPDNQKFIFLSESTIPLQDFNTVYETVMATDKSIFSFCSNVHQDKTRAGTFWGYHNYQPSHILHPIPASLQYKNPQWVILNRKHAQLMVEDTKYIEIISEYICDNEHYPSTFLAIKGLLGEVKNLQTTYDDWIKTSSGCHPYTFTNLEDEDELAVVVKAIKGGLYSNPNKYLFGRKFAKDCVMKPLDKYLTYKWDWQ